MSNSRLSFKGYLFHKAFLNFLSHRPIPFLIPLFHVISAMSSSTLPVHPSIHLSLRPSVCPSISLVFIEHLGMLATFCLDCGSSHKRSIWSDTLESQAQPHVWSPSHLPEGSCWITMGWKLWMLTYILTYIPNLYSGAVSVFFKTMLFWFLQ